MNIRSLVQSSAFNNFIIGVILVNAVVIGLSTYVTDPAAARAISGIEIVLHPNAQIWERDAQNPWKASLDRIDSTRGYLKGNVRYVTVIANFCKQGFSDEDVLAFARGVVQHHPCG